MLEIASPSSRRTDRVDKRRDYAALGIPEYWRFDEAASRRELRLAGDRLVDGRYEPIAIEELEDGVLQGYSAALNIYLRWEHGQLRLHDPATGRHIARFEDERARADAEREGRLEERDARIEEMEARAAAEAERNAEREARIHEQEARAVAETERNAEREARLAAEARVRELEERLSQQNP